MTLIQRLGAQRIYHDYNRGSTKRIAFNVTCSAQDALEKAMILGNHYKANHVLISLRGKYIRKSMRVVGILKMNPDFGLQRVMWNEKVKGVRDWRICANVTRVVK